MAAPAFPSGILRWTGDWSASTTYKYGDVVLASDNTSYACGIVSSLNQNPVPAPSVAWAAFPNQGGGGGGGVTSISGAVGVVSQTCNIGTYSNPSPGSVALQITVPPAPVQSVTAGIGLRNSGSSSAVSLNVPISTWAIDENLKQVQSGATTLLWTTNSFTPLVEGPMIINFGVTCQNNEIISYNLILELFYKPSSTAEVSLGTIEFRVPQLPSGAPGVPITGFNGSFVRTEYLDVLNSYTIYLKGTCTAGITANPWDVVTSIGYVQTGLPLYAM